MVSFGLLGQLLLSSSLTQKGFFLVQLTRYDIFGKALIPKSFSADYSSVRLSSTRTDAAARTALHQTFVLSAASILNSLGIRLSELRCLLICGKFVCVVLGFGKFSKVSRSMQLVPVRRFRPKCSPVLACLSTAFITARARISGSFLN
jgi:hypothetical protein